MIERVAGQGNEAPRKSGGMAQRSRWTSITESLKFHAACYLEGLKRPRLKDVPSIMQAFSLVATPPAIYASPEDPSRGQSVQPAEFAVGLPQEPTDNTELVASNNGPKDEQPGEPQEKYKTSADKKALLNSLSIYDQSKQTPTSTPPPINLAPKPLETSTPPTKTTPAPTPTPTPTEVVSPSMVKEIEASIIKDADFRAHNIFITGTGKVDLALTRNIFDFDEFLLLREAWKMAEGKSTIPGNPRVGVHIILVDDNKLDQNSPVPDGYRSRYLVSPKGKGAGHLYFWQYNPKEYDVYLFLAAGDDYLESLQSFPDISGITHAPESRAFNEILLKEDGDRYIPKRISTLTLNLVHELIHGELVIKNDVTRGRRDGDIGADQGELNVDIRAAQGLLARNKRARQKDASAVTVVWRLKGGRDRTVYAKEQNVESGGIW